MNAKRLCEVMERCGWGSTALGVLLGYSRQGVVQWRRGRVKIPGEVSEWLDYMDRIFASCPPPVRSARDEDDAVADVKPAPIDFDDDL